MEYAKAYDEAINYKGKQLGYVFVRGMTQDLADWTKNPEEADMTSFYASIAFLYLQGLITSSETVREIVGILMNDHSGEKDLRKAVAGISRTIFEDLIERSKDNCRNVDDLTQYLNKMSIPKWVFEWGKDLTIKMCEGLFTFNGSLFYLTEDKRFIRLIIRGISTRGTLDEPMSDYEELGRGYEKLFGFDRVAMRAFLKAERQDDFYHCFDVQTKTFSIHSGEMLTVNEGVPYIYKDGYISYVVGEEIHKLKKHEKNEGVSCEKDYMRIIPLLDEGEIFCPYRLSYDGTIDTEVDEYNKDYIWTMINAETRIEKMLAFKLIRGKVSRPRQMTINGILEAYKEAFKYLSEDQRKSYVALEGILKCFEPYLDENADVTKLLYSLYRNNQTTIEDDFPSERLYWRVKEITADETLTESLRGILKDQKYDELEKMLTEDKKQDTDKEEIEEVLIGTFEVNNDELQVTTMGKKEGIVLGSLIVPCEMPQFHKGTIYYDSTLNQYNITCAFELTECTRKNIVSVFNLEEFNYVFWVQQRGEEKMTTKKQLVIPKNELIKSDDDDDEYDYGDGDCLIDLFDALDDILLDDINS